MSGEPIDRERALIATGEELAGLLHHPAAEVLLAILDNPALDETQLCLLLERKDLPGEILEEVARRKALLKNYRVKRALAFHPQRECLDSAHGQVGKPERLVAADDIDQVNTVAHLRDRRAVQHAV